MTMSSILHSLQGSRVQGLFICLFFFLQLNMKSYTLLSNSAEGRISTHLQNLISDRSPSQGDTLLALDPLKGSVAPEGIWTLQMFWWAWPWLCKLAQFCQIFLPTCLISQKRYNKVSWIKKRTIGRYKIYWYGHCRIIYNNCYLDTT